MPYGKRCVLHKNQLLAKSKISKYVGFSGFLRDLRIKLSIKFPSPPPPKKEYKTCCHGVLFYLTLAYLPLLSALLRSLVFHCIQRMRLDCLRFCLAGAL